MKRELEDVERFLKYHRESLQQVCYSQMLIYCLYLFAKGQWYWYVIDFWHSLFLLECRLKQRTTTHKRAQENQNHQSHQLLMHHKKETSDTYLKASELTSLDLAYYLPPVPLSELFFLGELQKWYRMIIYSRWLMSISFGHLQSAFPVMLDALIDQTIKNFTLFRADPLVFMLCSPSTSKSLNQASPPYFMMCDCWAVWINLAKEVEMLLFSWIRVISCMWKIWYLY